MISLRGNVETRLRKLGEGHADATILALAGLKRLDLTDAIATIMSDEEFLPAVGQGAIVVETREDDSRTRESLRVHRSRGYRDRAGVRTRFPRRA